MPSNSKNHTRRRIPMGTTLIEVLATLTLLLVLGVSAASILGSITAIGARTSHSDQARVSMARLAQQFRKDVHRASDIQVSESPEKLEITLDSATVDYRWDEQTRTVTRRVQPSSDSQQPQSERYQLDDRCEPQVSVSQERVTVVWNGGTHRWVMEASRP